MKKIVKGLFSHVIALSSLSVMVLTRYKIGQNVFLPWGVKVTNGFARAFLRLWIIALLYVWIRIFFIIDIKNSTHPAPFNPTESVWRLFTHFGLHAGISSHIFLYYLSYGAAIAGFIHLIAIEYHYRARNPIGEGSLGDSYITGRLEDVKIFGCLIDKFLLWGLIDPAAIISIGYLLFKLTHSKTLFVFFMAAGISMFIQGQFARLQHREQMQGLINAKKSAETIRRSNKGFKNKEAGVKENENEAGFV